MRITRRQALCCTVAVAAAPLVAKAQQRAPNNTFCGSGFGFLEPFTALSASQCFKFSTGL